MSHRYILVPQPSRLADASGYLKLFLEIDPIFSPPAWAFRAENSGDSSRCLRLVVTMIPCCSRKGLGRFKCNIARDHFWPQRSARNVIPIEIFGRLPVRKADFETAALRNGFIFDETDALPPGFNSLQEQERFEAFLRQYNAERPQEALDMKCPAELYTASTRCYDGLPELTYPFHDRDVVITACGRLCLPRRRVNISTVPPGQKLCIKDVDDGIWLASRAP
jgi:hypothetical protein